MKWASPDTSSAWTPAFQPPDSGVSVCFMPDSSSLDRERQTETAVHHRSRSDAGDAWRPVPNCVSAEHVSALSLRSQHRKQLSCAILSPTPAQPGRSDPWVRWPTQLRSGGRWHEVDIDSGGFGGRESETAFFNILQPDNQRRPSDLEAGAGGRSANLNGNHFNLDRNHFLATGFPKEKGTGCPWHTRQPVGLPAHGVALPRAGVVLP